MNALVGLMAVAVSTLGVALPVMAHNGEESYVYLEIYDSSVEGRVEIPAADLNDILSVDIPEEEAAAREVVASNLAEIQAYADANLMLGVGPDIWSLEFEGFDILATNVGTFVVVPFAVDRQFDGVPRQFDTTYTAVIESKPERTGLLLIDTDFGSGTFNNESEHLLVYTADTSTQTVHLDDSSLFKGLVAVIGLGVEHIQIGSDHILFIIALVLPAVLVFRQPDGWLPAPHFSSSLWRVFKIATSFTIAHTITLTLGGLGVIELSPRLVEPIIAISIALAALHNIRPILLNREWLVAFGFGLFHGFGFAGLLAELGLDRSNRVVSLLGFNIGIELGQVAIIAMVFPALFMLRRTRIYKPVMVAASWALILVATAWFLDRVFDLDVGVDRLVTPVLRWPRSFLWVLVGTALAAIWFMVERRIGRLIPTDAADSRPSQLEATSTVS